ncbi:ABC transporter permease subunit [Rossellomorea aquimaris]|uniref:ABC transporter permease n=1 Tax=Rossellomorea aquimaris TaxID=189382 RepID=UPI001CD1B6D2|nr:ABC transporter permease subunit [Rossellomorea aquimaris]MCA1060779.1 ABC transporter permease subunit [Rossellomorea aquimaris]
MVKKIFKNKRFLVGFSFISVLLVASLMNMILNDGDIRQKAAIYEKGKIVETAPFKPSLTFPLGTDASGNDLLHVIIEGAKYTIGISLCIAFLQIILGAVIGTLFSGYLTKTFKLMEHFLSTFSVIPITLMSYFILINVLSMPIDGFAEPFSMRASFELVILVLLPLPSVILYISKETQKIMNTEFVLASRTLGAGTFRIIVFHVVKHLVQKLVILFIQQLNQILIILAHLGLLKMFFGGTVIDFSPMQDPPKTLSFEWSGLIGDYFEMLYVHPFIVLVPITFFALTIVSMNLILNGLESVYEEAYRKVVSGKRDHTSHGRTEMRQGVPEKDFLFANPSKFYRN